MVRRRLALVFLFLFVPAVWLSGNQTQASAQPAIALEPVASGLASVVDIQSPRDGTGRLFYVLQGGRIMVHHSSVGTFLDMSSRVATGGERGLLGLAFHPNYSSNGLFYVFYTRNPDGALTLDRYQVSSDPNAANALSRVQILEIAHPRSNHNGGQIRFGPDGFLYIATGDGGGADDPDGNAQNAGSLLGKLLRIDVNGGSPYAIPPGNPWVGVSGAHHELWAAGLRNPWRFSFDRSTGDVFIGDVGQSLREEINFQPAGAGGRNYGWDVMEGTECHEPPTGCSTSGLVTPVVQYPTRDGCAVTGGFRYRAGRFPSLNGYYLYADYCNGRIFAANPDAGWSTSVLLDTSYLISTFGEGENGDVYISDHRSSGGVYRIVVPGSGSANSRGDAPFASMGVHPSGNGYWLAATDGGVFTFGSIPFFGSMGGQPLAAPVVGMTSHPSGNGYWLVGGDGGVFTFGNIAFYGSAGGIPLRAPVVGIAPHPSGNGYWLVASDGGVFTFGNIPFYGSAASIPLNAPVVGMAAHPSGNGYWLVASDGGVFTFGNVAFHGSAGHIPLAAPVVGMGVHPSGNGYWLDASDGGVFTFGSIPYFGSMGGRPLAAPVVGMGVHPSGNGYWLLGRDGGVFTFGSIPYFGSRG